MYDMREWLAEHRGAELQRLILKAQIVFSLSAGADESVQVQVREALKLLAQTDPRQRLVRMVEIRYLAGDSRAQVAEAMDLTDRTELH